MKSRRTSEKSGTRSPGPKNSSSGDKIFGHGLKVGRRHGLASRTGLSLANASQHLQQMRRGGLVVALREGKFVRYRLSDNSVLDLVAALRTIAEQHLAEVDRIVRSYFRNRDDLEAVSRKELMHDSRIACCRSRPSRGSARAALRLAPWRTVYRNGALLGCRAASDPCPYP